MEPTLLLPLSTGPRLLIHLYQLDNLPFYARLHDVSPPCLPHLIWPFSQLRLGDYQYSYLTLRICSNVSLIPIRKEDAS